MTSACPDINRIQTFDLQLLFFQESHPQITGFSQIKDGGSPFWNLIPLTETLADRPVLPLPYSTTILSSPDSKSSSYGQILKSSSIIGGAQGMSYLISMVRTKAVAIFLGPAGMGLVGLYMTAIGFVSTFSALGISSSAVKQVAEADGVGDEARLTHTIKALRRICYATGFLGWALTAIFARPLSLWVFGSHDHAWPLAILGATILLADISGGQSALLQGKRRIGDLARLNVLSSVIGSIVSVTIYACLHERGIIPVMLATAAISLGSSWWFARRVSIVEMELSWRDTWPEARRMIQLGVAFMWSAVLVSGLALATRALIAHMFGLNANGIYQAAWGISGMFAGFITAAMGTDFYPRLTGASQNNELVNRLVNEQTEIGILLALPGLIGTLMFAPWAMRIFYSAKFLPGAELLPWFVLGIFGRVLSWPMAFIMLAKGEGRWFALSETAVSILHLSLIFCFMRAFGLWGVALAFAVLYFAYTIMVYFISRRLTGFAWTSAAIRLFATSFALVLAGFGIQKWIHGVPGCVLGLVLTAAASMLTLRGISSRLGDGHRLVRMILKLPCGRHLCGI
jgi:PST family polysaccharide transporter